MKENTALGVAYFIITRGFTLGLISLIFILSAIIVSLAGGGAPDFADDLELFVKEPGHRENIVSARGASSGQDVSLVSTEKSLSGKEYTSFHVSTKTYVKIEAGKAAKIVPFHFYFQLIRKLMTYLTWMFFTWQVFLILYDIKHRQSFAAKNERRIRRIGYALLFLAVYYCLVFDFYAELVGDTDLFIGVSPRLALFPGDAKIYLITGILMFVLSAVFAQGTRLREEVELTV